MKSYRSNTPFSNLKNILTIEEIDEMKEQVKTVTISEEVEDYILKIIHSTRNHEDIQLGISPRGTLALMRASQGKAYINNRTFVTPQDVKDVAIYLLSHRLVLSLEASLKKNTIQVIETVLSQVEVPVEAGAGQ
jgi:MoxR-like ATPase